jgi:LmbE family N-acetylglucosaminyl deacetylase
MNILVVAAHPDDEAFGCGGTLAKHIDQGDSVSILTLTDGVSSRDETEKIDQAIRNESFIKSCDCLGIKKFRSYSYPDNKMDSVPILDITKTIENYIKEVQPDLVYTHFYNDLNIDHRVTSNAVLTACRPQPGFSVKEIRMFEVVSSSDWNSGDKFNPNLLVDIKDYYSKKLASLRCYESELRPWPHQRSYEAIESIAKVRGSLVGFEMAEAFMVYRRLE